MDVVSTPVEIVCCYSPVDELWCQKLETHLSGLKRQGLISFWYDRLIAPGTDWSKTIDAHLETAPVILLLVSADFFASDYCHGIELKRVLEREASGEARVIPILVRPVDWKKAQFAHLQVLPIDAKPIASRRNKEEALVNVAAGIRRVIVEDLPQFSTSVPRIALPTIWNIPYPRNPFFLGRESELTLVHQRLQASQRVALCQPQAISGLGGIGKTQLALEYAYRYRQDYQIVLWARAESTEALVSSYVAIAKLLRLPEQGAREQEVTVQAVKDWLQKHPGWLLIMDNAEEPTLHPNFLPLSEGGHLLLTTQAFVPGQLARRLEIDPLQPEHGALLLLRRAGLLDVDESLEQASQKKRERALQISQELDGFPLALDQAGAHLEETGTDLDSFYDIYQQHRTDLLQQRGRLVIDHPASVVTTLDLSFQRVKERSPAAADLLRLLALLAPDAIPEEILTEGTSLLGPVLSAITADGFLLNQAITVLRAFSLIQRKEKTLSVHRLVQAVLKDNLEEAERYYWAERAVLAVNAALPECRPEVWSKCERLLPHALVVAQLIDQHHFINQEAGRLLFETAHYLLERARYTEAEPLFQRAQLIWEQNLGSQHLHVGKSLRGRANVYSEQGRYEDAQSLYEQAHTIFEYHLGSEHPQIASLFNNQAILSKVRGEPDEAEKQHMRCLNIRVRSLIPDHPNMASLLRSLIALSNIGCGPDRIHEQSICCVMNEKTEVLKFAQSLNNLAVLFVEQCGKYETAERLLQFSLGLQEQSLGREDPDFALTLNNLGNLYAEWGSKYRPNTNIRATLPLVSRMLEKGQVLSLPIFIFYRGCYPFISFNFSLTCARLTCVYRTVVWIAGVPFIVTCPR